MDIIHKNGKYKSGRKSGCLGIDLRNTFAVCSDQFLLVVSHDRFQQRETTTGCIHRLMLPLVQKKLEETGEFTNLSEVTGIWELSGLVPTCDAAASSVHTLWFSEKITKEGDG